MFVGGACAALFASAACSSQGDDEVAPEPAFLGRYGLKGDDTAAYSTLWFSKDARYEAVRARCTNDCIETGTFTQRNGALTLETSSGQRSQFRITGEGPDREQASTASLRPRGAGDAVPVAEAANDDNLCAGPTTASLRPQAGVEECGGPPPGCGVCKYGYRQVDHRPTCGCCSPRSGGALLGGASCLLTGRVTRAILSAQGTGSPIEATLEGNRSPTQRIAMDPASMPELRR